MAKITTASDSDYIRLWQQFRDSFQRSATVDIRETFAEKVKRVKFLEANPEEWFKYYFPNYCKNPTTGEFIEPADFQKKSTKIVLSRLELYLIRSWFRESAKSSRSMMEDIYQAMTGKITNLLLVSNTHGNAERLLLEYKAFFEVNPRMIHDYGAQQKLGNWKADEFSIKKGCSFRAIGWGESPRGTKNENRRPDKIRIDDIDTDEECRNEDIMNAKVNWIEQALIATRSISEPCQIVFCGNIIHENCAVNRLKDIADRVEIVNIRDKNGKSSWPQKNSEEQIDRVLSKISYESAQKEYFNNPMDGGDTFTNLKDGKVPKLNTCHVCIYADPATSNKDVSSGSYKAVGIIAKKGFDFFIVKAALDTMSNAKFVDFLFDFYKYCKAANIENVKVFIENNSLQNPFYEQVLLPMIYQQANDTGVFLPISGDDRDKKDKYTRIEGTLEPINRLGHLIFNEAEAENPHIKRLKAQFKSFSRKQKRMDGPDMVEGAVFKLNEAEAAETAGWYEVVKPRRSKRWDS
jgi:hypothetical protein